jgi:hypothetical protein
MGHARKHLPDFRALDASLTEDEVAQILESGQQTGVPSPAPHGATVYRAMVEIGGSWFPVIVVESASGVIKTGYPEVP